jgi:transposase
MNYLAFIGIDIGKYEFVAAEYNAKKTQTYQNNESGWYDFFRNYFNLIKSGLVVLETTGGYENDLVLFLVEKNIAVHRADTRKVKSFIRSFGQKAKTDSIDAKALASYGYERHAKLKLFIPANNTQNTLKILEERRQNLKQMLVKEKNRLKAPLNRPVLENIQVVINCLEIQIEDISSKLDGLINADPSLIKKQEILKSIPGIGEITSRALLSLLPELGHLDGKRIASLCGVAPHARQSGTKIWYSRTFGGRRNLRPILYMAAMAARNAKKTTLGEFYERLVSSGKKKMVALVALMRKIIIIANARLRDLMSTSDHNDALID